MAKPIPSIAGQDDDSKEVRTRLKQNYMSQARESLDRAKSLLIGEDEGQLRYAALDLRQAFEALVYENALGYSDELVGEDYLVWQPTQILEKILEIDPFADKPLELSIQDPKTKEWHKLGTQSRIGLGALKKLYFALGNRLHTPSLAEAMRNKPPKHGAFRKLCNECVELIERDLNASLRMDGSIFGSANLDCMSCGTVIRRRLDALRTPQNNNKKTKEVIIANCSGCVASYAIRWEEDGYSWETQKWRAKCPFTDCKGVHEKWTREVTVGMLSKCPACGKRSKIIDSYTFLPEAVTKQIGK